MNKFIIRHSRLLLIVGGVFIYLYLFMVFYPSTYAIQDEANYFDFAYKLKTATVYSDPVTSHKVIFDGKNYIDMYPPGMAILLLPFTFLGWKALFLTNPLLHLLGFLFFIKSLKLLKLDTGFSLFYLFFPSFVLYSRTIMPDLAMGSIVSMAIYFYLGNKRTGVFLSGILFGFLTLIKNVSLLIPIVFILCLFVKKYRKETPKYIILSFIAGLLPFTCLAVAYNFIRFGSLISSPVLAGGSLSIKFLFSHFIFYFIFMILLYPVMFFAPFFYKQETRPEFAFSTITYLAFISMWSFIQPISGALKQLVVGSRYLLIILPIYLLTYAEAIGRISINIKQRVKSLIFILAVVFLVTSAYVINAQHHRYLKQQLSYADTLYANTSEGAFIVCNPEAKELLQKIWGDRKWASFADANLKEYLKPINEFYIVAFLRKDKPKEFIADTKTKNAMVGKYNARLIKEIKQPHILQIYKAGK